MLKIPVGLHWNGSVRLYNEAKQRRISPTNDVMVGTEMGFHFQSINILQTAAAREEKSTYM